MQDAFNLGWKLALVVSGKGSDHLIASYEAERRPVDRAIVQSGDEAYVRMDSKGQEARREVVDFLATSEGQHYAALAESEIAFAYEESPLVEEIGRQPASSPNHTPIGARVGEVTELAGSGGALSLHDLVHGKMPTLFVLPGEGSPTALAEARTILADASDRIEQAPESAFIVLRGQALETTVAADLIFDPTGLLHERLGDAGPCLCVIRPDGHLGFRSSPPDLEALDTYLGRIYAA
jgi:hypothetical protein